MAPLTLVEKYDDLVRSADQPLTSYDKLNDKDYNDVINKIWPFIIKSVTYTPLILKRNDSIMSSVSFEGKVRIDLERRLKLKYQLYSKIAKEYQQIFPDRKPIEINKQNRSTENESLSFETTAAFSIDQPTETNLPDFYVLCSIKDMKKRRKHFDHLIKYIIETTEISPQRELILKQAIQVR